MTNSVRLRSLISESGLKLKKIAEIMGITAYSLQKKMDNVTEFKASEIIKLSNILHIEDVNVINEIFLNER